MEAGELDFSSGDDEWVIVELLVHTQNQQDDELSLQDHGLLQDRCSDEDDDCEDALHDWALDEFKEQSCVRSPNTRLLDRYDADLVREAWHEYVGSVGTSARIELHQAKMISFHGYGPDPAPFLQGSDCFNPLFEQLWLPWAIDAQYCHNEDIGLLASEMGASGLDFCMHAAHLYRNAAIPTRPMLEYMVNHAPVRKIAHVDGTCSPYWASLLRYLGANILLIKDDFFPDQWMADSWFGHFCTMGEKSFFELPNAHALFFCQTSKVVVDDGGDDDMQRSCRLFERCLSHFQGDMVFFVGEIGKMTKSFDMAQWVDDNSQQGWCIEEEIELPCWPGPQEVFLCCVKKGPSHGA